MNMVENAFNDLPALLGAADSLSEAKVVALFVHSLVQQNAPPQNMRVDMAYTGGEQPVYPDLGFMVDGQQHWMEVKYFKSGTGASTAKGGTFLKDLFRLAGFKQDAPEPTCWLLHVYDGEPTQLFTDAERWQDWFLKNGTAEARFTFDLLNHTTQKILIGHRWQGEKRFRVQNMRLEPEGSPKRILVLTRLIQCS